MRLIAISLAFLITTQTAARADPGDIQLEGPDEQMSEVLSQVSARLGSVRRFAETDDVERLCEDVDDGTSDTISANRKETWLAAVNLLGSALRRASSRDASMSIVRTLELRFDGHDLLAQSPDAVVEHARNYSQAEHPEVTDETGCTALLTFTVRSVTMNKSVVTAVSVEPSVLSIDPRGPLSALQPFTMSLKAAGADAKASTEGQWQDGVQLELGASVGGFLWWNEVHDPVAVPDGKGAAYKTDFLRRGAITAALPAVDVAASLSHGALWSGLQVATALALDYGEDGIRPTGAARLGVGARTELSVGGSPARELRVGGYVAGLAMGHWLTGDGLQFNATQNNVFFGIVSRGIWFPRNGAAPGAPYFAVDGRLGVSPIGALHTPSISRVAVFDDVPPIEMLVGAKVGIQL